MDNAKKLIRRYNNALPQRDRFKELYKRVYQYIMPDNYTQIEDKQEGQNMRIDLYTSVPEQAADHFVQRVQSLLTPVNTDWIGFEAGFAYTADDDNDPVEVNQSLERIAHICNVFKDVSNFDSEVTSFYYDLVAGTAYLAVFEGTSENPLVFKTIPFKEMVIEEGVDGTPDHYYRMFKIKNEHIKEQWKDAKFEYKEENAQEEVELLECTYKDGDKWAYNVIYLPEEKIVVERKFKTSPFICLRWTKSSHEIYGRGCGLKALSDIMTLNKIKNYTLRALALSLPIFTASRDGGYDADEFVAEPGAVNSVPSNMSNNPTIQQLQVTQQPEIQKYNATELEMDIKKAMFDTTIPNDPQNMTATEINQRAGELAEQLNNSFGRLINEFLYPLTKRIVNVLQSFGHIPDDFDVNKFNGFGYKIKINTQLANKQKAGELNNIIQFLNVMVGFDPQMQMLPKVVNLPELAIRTAKLSGIDFDLIRTEDEVRGMQEEEQQLAAQQQQQAMIDQINMNNAMEQGKADAQNSYK